MKTLVVIAHHNGSQYIPNLLASLNPSYEVLIVDTGSTSQELDRLPREARVDEIAGGYCVGAYEWAYTLYPEYDAYFFMHDSMVAKKTDFLPEFESRGDVVAWIGFPMDYGPAEIPYLSRQYDLLNKPSTAIFGPIFYATRNALDRLKLASGFPIHPRNRTELCASERAYAFGFKEAGVDIQYIEEYDNERLDVIRDYRLFDKFRPNRL